MKVRIEFNLPDDTSDMYLALRSMELWSLLYDLDQHCRAELKYAEMSADKVKVYEEIRDFLYDNNWGSLQNMVE